MARKVATPVNAKFIRQAAREGKVTITDAALACVTGGPQGTGRGRLSPELIQAFEAENPGFVYAGEKNLTAKTVELPLTKPNARGARLKRPESVPVSEVRARAGVEGKAGRLSNADKVAAAESIMRERGWL